MLRWIERWLYREPIGFWRTSCFVFYAFAVWVLYTASLMPIFFEAITGRQWGASLTIAESFLRVVYLALIEEIYFRLPLVIFIFWDRHRRDTSGTSLISNLIWFSIFSSVIFGYMHGAPVNIFIQGVGGFILCATFLKCGAMNCKLGKALAASTAVHALWNCYVLVLSSFQRG